MSASGRRRATWWCSIPARARTTASSRRICPDAPAWDTVIPTRRSDGRVYATFGSNLLRVDDEAVTRVATAPDLPPLKLRDGRIVTAFGRGSFSLRDPRTGQVVERTFKYAGAGDMIFVVGVGPGGAVYGSTAMPLEVFRYDSARREAASILGDMVGGEVYSMLEDAGKLYLCYYPGAIMNLYDPAKPVWKFGTGADCNPISFGGVGDGHLRPRAMIRGPGGLIYIGSEPPYGQLGGALGRVGPAPEQDRRELPQPHHEPKHRLPGLRTQERPHLWRQRASGAAAAHTQRRRKPGSLPSTRGRSARCLKPRSSPGAGNYPATVRCRGQGVHDGRRPAVRFRPAYDAGDADQPPPGGADRNLAGPASKRVAGGVDGRRGVCVDPSKGEVIHTAPAPTHINCGFALTDEAVYFGSGPTLWRYRLPPLRPAALPERGGR